MRSRSIASIWYKPQTDGQKEKLHKTLEKVFCAYILDSDTKYIWLSSLTFVEFATNSTSSEFADKLPFELVYLILSTLFIDRLGSLHIVDRALYFVIGLMELMVSARA